MKTRLSSRINVVLKVISEIDKRLEQNIKLVGGNRFEVSAFDISRNGIGFTIKKYFLPKGLLINLSIDGAPFGLEKPIKIKGEIRYCKCVKYEMYKCGVKFLDMPKRYKKVITQFISNYNRRKKARF